MPTKALTDRVVANAKPPKSGRVELWDAELPGFGLRISSAGRRSWQVMYRVDGRKRRLSLGIFPALPLKLARDAARATLKEVAKGNDPAAQRASVRGGKLTFERFAQAYTPESGHRRKLASANLACAMQCANQGLNRLQQPNVLPFSASQRWYPGNLGSIPTEKAS